MFIRRWVPIFLATAILAFAQKPKELKPGWNLFSVDQDIQMGQEYAQQVRQQMPMVRDARVVNYVNEIGRRLTSGITGSKFPFTFEVVNDPSINAFALPGGPMFVHTGLIAAADNEAQIAGVLAHEIGHVALRHGTNQASKANLIQIPAMIAAGMLDRGGVTGALTQLGIGLGANSVLMKFSRGAETDADLYGARLMHQAGYNPVELARFFEKLEAEHGKGSALSQFFSNHPNPGNRIKSIEADMRHYDRRQYNNGNSAQLASTKDFLKTLPAPVKGQPGQQAGAAAQGPPVAISAPSGFKAHQTSLYATAYPNDWQIKPGQDGVSVTLHTADGIVRARDGSEQIGHGVIQSFAQAQANNIDAATQELVKGLQQSNPGVQVAGKSQSLRIDGYTARLTPMVGPSPLRSNEREYILLLSVMHPRALFYGVYIAPESRWRVAEAEFQRMMQSIRFAPTSGAQRNVR
jgi:beta-barrel assembly-enhancing protease